MLPLACCRQGRSPPDPTLQGRGWREPYCNPEWPEEEKESPDCLQMPRYVGWKKGRSWGGTEEGGLWGILACLVVCQSLLPRWGGGCCQKIRRSSPGPPPECWLPVLCTGSPTPVRERTWITEELPSLPRICLASVFVREGPSPCSIHSGVQIGFSIIAPQLCKSLGRPERLSLSFSRKCIQTELFRKAFCVWICVSNLVVLLL